MFNINNFFKTKDETILIKRAFDEVFSSKEGKIVLTQLANQCLPQLGSCYENPHKAYHEQGKLYMLMFILRLANIDVNNFLAKYSQKDTFNPLSVD